MAGLFRRGGRTDRFSSRVIDEENGFNHEKSLNHEDPPKEESFASGGLCTAGRNGESHDSGTMLAAPITASEVVLDVLERIMSQNAKKTTMTRSAVLRWGISIFARALSQL